MNSHSAVKGEELCAINLSESDKVRYINNTIIVEVCNRIVVLISQPGAISHGEVDKVKYVNMPIASEVALAPQLAGYCLVSIQDSISGDIIWRVSHAGGLLESISDSGRISLELRMGLEQESSSPGSHR